MDVSPARIAEMLAPLAEKFNAAAAHKGDDGRRRYVPRLSGWDLARVWLVAGACVSVDQVRAAADIGIHTATASLRVLETGGWLVRRPTASGDEFDQRILLSVSDNPDALGPAQPGTRLVM